MTGIDGPVRAFGAVVSALMICVLAIGLTISLAAFVFVGPLTESLGQGIVLGLVGGLALAIVGAFGTSYRGTICGPQDITATILALSAGAVASRLDGADTATLFATVAVLIGTASLACGAAFLAAGSFRLGFVARFIPYPVLGGFFAATGYLLTLGAIGTATGAAGMEGLLDPDATVRWLPVVVLGAATMVAVRLTGNALAVPAVMTLAIAGFYGGLALAGIDLDEAGRRGLLLGPFGPGAGLASTLDPGLLARADYGEILREAPAIATLVGLALIGAILNASGIEFATGEAVDVNRDLRGVGLANLAAGAGGGLAGYHILGETLLARRIVGRDARWIGVTVGLAYAATLLAGPSLLSVLPTGVFAALLAYLGIDLLYEWLWVERRRMPAQDFAIVLLIVAAAATIGFLEAVAIGVFAASMVFILAYSRFDVVRACAPAALRPSMTERSDTAMRQLAQAAARTLVFELQGYVFFGTAHALYRRIGREVAARPELDRIVVDFRRVQGLDVSAAFNIGKLEQDCRRQGLELWISGVGEKLRRPLDLARLSERVRAFETLDDALSAAEEEILADPDPGPTPEIAALVARAAAAGKAFPSERAPAGAVVLRQGDPSDCMMLLERGRLSARRAAPDGTEATIAGFLPGAVVGEIGFYAEMPRTASVVADSDAVIHRIGRADLEELSRHAPELANDFHVAVAGLLARRLTRTTALLREVAR